MQSTLTRKLRSSVIRTGVKHKYASLKEFGEHLQEDPALLTYCDRKMKKNLTLSSQLIKSSTYTHHIIFYDPEFISEFNEENDIFIDATFNVRPDIKGVSQFMTIMSKKYNDVTIHFSIRGQS